MIKNLPRASLTPYLPLSARLKRLVVFQIDERVEGEAGMESG